VADVPPRAAQRRDALESNSILTREQTERFKSIQEF
jgi:hypothetical protein